MPVFSFGPFDLDSETGELTRNGGRVRLRPQPCAVLQHLIEHAGAFVSRAQLHQHLWPEGTFVDFDQGLNSCIKQVRAALGDSGRQPRYIETLSRRGYRFIVPVSVVSTPVGRVSRRRPPVVAVDAFRPVGEDAVLTSLAEGLREEVLTALGHAAAERRAFVVRSGAADPADFVLCCSVRTSAARFRVVARLIRPSSGTHTWAAGFDGGLDDPLRAETDVAHAIVRDVHDVVAGSAESDAQGSGPPERTFRTVPFKNRAS
jgi:DNA-binding winged helix-turn-helix (wHTH) protein